MNKLKYSIIIPLYNAEKYCKECIDSILYQTYQNYELILINDGSLDNTDNICRSYQKDNQRIINYISQENKGQAIARNVGVAAAKGEYIIFVDADDRLDNNNVLAEINKLLNQHQDLLLFGYAIINENNIKQTYSSSKLISQLRAEYDSGMVLLDEIVTKKPEFRWYPWQFVFKREVWNNNGISFPNRRIGEDQAIIYKYLTNCGSCAISGETVYNYRVGNSESITAHENYKHWHDYLNVCADMLKEIKKSDAYTSELKAKLLSSFSIGYYTVLIHSTYIEKEKIQAILQELKENKWMTSYSLQKKQILARRIIGIIGVKNTAYLLRVRRKIRR